MLQSGRVVFSQMEQVLFGIPAAQAVAEQAQAAQRVFLMVSGTLNRQTDEVEKVRRALGNRCVGTFDRRPSRRGARSSPRPSRPASFVPTSSSRLVAGLSLMAPRPCSYAWPTAYARQKSSTHCVW